MGFTILSVAYPLTEVGVDAPGGSEQILTMLDRHTTRSGNRSLVLAAEGSKVEGTLLASPRVDGPITEADREFARRVHRRLIMDALARYNIDLIHMQSLDFYQYMPPGSVPVLATLHLPPNWYPKEAFKIRRSNFYFHCVSASQERTCPNGERRLPYVGNGIELSHFRPGRKKNFVLALGRICPEKGFHFALDAARKANCEMILAGKVFPFADHQEYFREEIRPRLDSHRRFIGPVGLAKKRELLAQARALLIPSTVEETSSLVAMEALASGTPVIAFDSGALPEIIEHGRTGYLVENTASMAKALGKVKDLDILDCRASACTRFSAATMLSRYDAMYRQLLQRSRPQVETLIRPGVSWLVP
jgi:glycosyltransferase involved in cell wall biosynthesis